MQIGITFAPDDLLLPHDANKLIEAKKRCDYLIACVYVNLDKENRNEDDHILYKKYQHLRDIKVIDKLLLWTTKKQLIALMHIRQPHIRFVCSEIKDIDFIGKQFCIDNNIEIHYLEQKT